MQLLENMSSIKISPPIRGRVIAHKAQGAGAEKVDRGNMTKKMMKPTNIKKAVKSSRIGIDRSISAQIKAQDGGGAEEARRP